MTGSSLEIAKAVGGTVQQATDLTMENTMLPNVGPEAKVVGSAFALQANKICTNRRNSGVYVVKNVSTVKAPVLKNHAAYNEIESAKCF
jgi:peptidyl-prolyl cis-trans isomerase D